MEVYAQCRLLYPKAEIILQDDLDGKGKGWAIREGVKKSTRNLVCFIDADMDIHPIEIYKLLWEIDDCDIVVGNRVYNATFGRKVLSCGYKLMIRILFGWGLSIDTQSGIKLFRKDKLPTWETNSFAFDIEILYKAKNCSIKEVPVVSKIRETKTFGSIWETFVETLNVWKRVK